MTHPCGICILKLSLALWKSGLSDVEDVVVALALLTFVTLALVLLFTLVLLVTRSIAPEVVLTGVSIAVVDLYSKGNCTSSTTMPSLGGKYLTSIEYVPLATIGALGSNYSCPPTT